MIRGYTNNCIITVKLGWPLSYSGGQLHRHIVVTPLRNEVEFLPQLIDSMATQTIVPAEWVIVDDCSTDGSTKLVEEAEVRFEWIKLVKVDENSERERGGKISRLANIGLKSSDIEWSFLSKIDADIILPNTYFEEIFKEFDDEKLGIGSGNCFVNIAGKRKTEKVEIGHTRGALKTYRRSCFSDIGGLEEIDGWDGIDNLTARFHGWETRNFSHILAEHRRPTGSMEGRISECLSSGKKSHIMCYSWTYLIAKSLAMMLRRPFFIGGLCVFLGFIKSGINGTEKIKDKDLINFIRREQRNKLLQRIGIGRKTQ